MDTGTVSATVKLLLNPASAAEIVALRFELSVPLEMVNAAEDEPAGIVTDAGTINAGLFDDSAAVVPPVGAAVFKVSVQLALWLLLMVAGVH